MASITDLTSIAYMYVLSKAEMTSHVGKEADNGLQNIPPSHLIDQQSH